MRFSPRRPLSLPLTLALSAASLVAPVGCLEPAYAPRSGDLVFQTSRSEQSRAIQLATRSPFSHVGVIYVEDGEPLVFEAVQPVRVTPFEEWARRGEGGRFVAKRLRAALSPEDLARMKRLGEAWLGRDYDLAFAWSDERLYCSELVWKLFQRGAGIELSELESMQDFDLDHPEVAEAVHRRWGENPPEREPVVSPAALFESPRLETVWTQ